MSDKQLLFKVTTGAHSNEPHEYKVYTDGSIEGFPTDDTTIANYYPVLLRTAIAPLNMVIKSLRNRISGE